MVKKTLFSFILLSFLTVHAAAQPTVFLVRHAERADGGGGMMAADPELSATGQARAKSLANLLKDVQLTMIIATEFKRTQQTAAPVAEVQEVAVTTVESKNMQALLEKLKSAEGNVLVVGHSNSIPEVIKALGIATPVMIGDADYDNLFIVVPGSPPRLIRLHYR
jgi:broad specificity phosphatase PhoE